PATRRRPTHRRCDRMGGLAAAGQARSAPSRQSPTEPSRKALEPARERMCVACYSTSSPLSLDAVTVDGRANESLTGGRAKVQARVGAQIVLNCSNGWRQLSQ